jgi:hypothetical protein
VDIEEVVDTEVVVDTDVVVDIEEVVDTEVVVDTEEVVDTEVVVEEDVVAMVGIDDVMVDATGGEMNFMVTLLLRPAYVAVTSTLPVAAPHM